MTLVKHQFVLILPYNEFPISIELHMESYKSVLVSMKRNFLFSVILALDEPPQYSVLEQTEISFPFCLSSNSLFMWNFKLTIYRLNILSNGNSLLPTVIRSIVQSTVIYLQYWTDIKALTIIFCLVMFYSPALHSAELFIQLCPCWPPCLKGKFV